MLSVYMGKCSSGFTITFLQCCLCHLVSHRISLNPKQLARPPGAQEFQDSLPFFSEVPLDLLCCRQARNPDRLEAKSEASPALKPEQDFLYFNFPNIPETLRLDILPREIHMFIQKEVVARMFIAFLKLFYIEV